MTRQIKLRDRKIINELCEPGQDLLNLDKIPYAFLDDDFVIYKEKEKINEGNLFIF